MSSQEDAEPASARNSKDAMFEPKPKPKMIRVLTVLAYVLSVSMAAILLSIYYIFMWDGRPHIGARTSPDIQSAAEQNNSYLDAKYSEHMSDAGELFYNASNSFSNSSFLNKIKYVSSMDALRMVNGTNDDYEVILNRTTGQDGAKLNTTEKKVSAAELQQQITAMESEEFKPLSTTPTTAVEDSVTWPEDYETLEELKKSNPLIRKLMDSKYYENY